MITRVQPGSSCVIAVRFRVWRADLNKLISLMAKTACQVQKETVVSSSRRPINTHVTVWHHLWSTHGFWLHYCVNTECLSIVLPNWSYCNFFLNFYKHLNWINRKNKYTLNAYQQLKTANFVHLKICSFNPLYTKLSCWNFNLVDAD